MMRILYRILLCYNILALHIFAQEEQEQHTAPKDIKIGLQKSFDISGHITISVLNNRVDIRKWENDLPGHEGIAYTYKQWQTFVQRIPNLESNIGVYRLDRKSVIITKRHNLKIQLMVLFNGSPSIKGITVTLKQWFEIVNLVPRINHLIKAI